MGGELGYTFLIDGLKEGKLAIEVVGDGTDLPDPILFHLALDAGRGLRQIFARAALGLLGTAPSRADQGPCLGCGLFDPDRDPGFGRNQALQLSCPH
jgi:hypothetical protein